MLYVYNKLFLDLKACVRRMIACMIRSQFPGPCGNRPPRRWDPFLGHGCETAPMGSEHFLGP